MAWPLKILLFQICVTMGLTLIFSVLAAIQVALGATPMRLLLPSSPTIVPMVWVIEFFSLFIKHAILAIRLLSNMVAGHLVLLAIMGIAVATAASSAWPAAATISLSTWTELLWYR